MNGQQNNVTNTPQNNVTNIPQNTTQNPKSEERKCKKCEKRLPNKSYFCMYCGTDNAPTSVQVEYEKANNEALKKYTIIDAKKQSPIWYVLFMLLVIDAIVVSCVLMTKQQDAFIEVNSARFQNYEKSYYLGEEAYLSLKDNKLKIIGDNRIDYSEITNIIRGKEIKDIQEVYEGYFGDTKKIYIQTSNDKIYMIEDNKILEIELEKEEKYIDIYHYLNSQERNCYNDTEYIILAEDNYYYDASTNEIKRVGEVDYDFSGEKYCKNYQRTTTLAAEDLNLEKPKIIYQASDGDKIILKDEKELLEIKDGQITKRVNELTIKNETVKVEDIKEIFYDDGDYIVIDKNDKIYDETLNNDDIKDMIDVSKLISFKNLSTKDKIYLAVIFLVLIGDIIFLYKMNDQHTFSKVMSTSGLLMIEYVALLLIVGGGLHIPNAEVFFELIESLLLTYLMIVIISMVIVQIAELTVKLLDLIRFRNVFSYIPVLIAITTIFLSLLTTGKYGMFLGIFVLGTYWSYLTESEEIDIDLFVKPSSYVPLIVLFIANAILYFALLNIFKICNYFVILFLVAFLFAIYLAARPNLTKKELTGKSTKSLIVLILTLTDQFINVLFSMNLFTTLQKDDGTIMKTVLAKGFENVLYLVVTFGILIFISSILRILHKTIKTITKNMNTYVQVLLFSLISIILFTIIIYFLPEIAGLIEAGVNKIFTSLIKTK